MKFSVSQRNHGLIAHSGGERWRALWEMSVEAIALLNDQGCYLEINPATCKLFGLSEEELLGHSITEFTEFIEPEFSLPQLLLELKQQIGRGEFCCQCRNGQLRIVEYTLTTNILPHHHLLILHDITERQQAKAQVQALTEQLAQSQAQLQQARVQPLALSPTPSDRLLEQIACHIPGAIYQFRMRPDGTCHFPYASEGLKEIYGLSPAEVREDAFQVFTIIHSDDLDRVSQSILKSAQDLTPWYCEYRVVFAGKTRWLLGHATPIKESDGSTLWHGYIRDITEKKQVELALEESNIRWQLAIEGTGDGTWDWHLKTNQVHFSRQWKTMLGYEDHEISDDLAEWESRVHPEDKAKCYEDIGKHLRGEIPSYRNEHRLRCKDGSYKWILDRGRVVEWDKEGQPVRFIGTHSDISDRKTAELELENFFNVALDLLCIADSKGYFRRLNRAWQTTLGYSISELEGQPFLNFVHPDDLSATLAVMSALEQSQKPLLQFTNRYRAKDGSYRYIEWRSVPDGDLIYAAARDITERKAAEDRLNELSQRLSLALQSAEAGCWQWNILQNSLVWDDRMYELYGLSPEAETRIPYEIWVTAVHPDDREGAEILLNQALSGEAQFDPEFRVIHPDGSIHFIKAFGLVHRNAAGEPESMIGVNFDISDLKRQEEALCLSEVQLRQKTEYLEATLKRLQTTQIQLIQAEKMSSLGQLVAGIAHEINNPVNFIYANIEHAKDYFSELWQLIQLYQKYDRYPIPEITEFTESIDLEYIEGDFYKLLKSMKTGASRIKDIVKSLRTFSRLDEAEFKLIDIHENLESTLILLQSRFNSPAGNPEIDIHRQYGKLPELQCYGGLLNQVFMNLLLNAIDAIEQRRETLAAIEKSEYKGRITITTSMGSNNCITISIADNGCGMSTDIQDKIFNPFFTTKPVGKGTGMGLAMAYQIVTENHQGNLEVASVLGQGSEFTITLPWL